MEAHTQAGPDDTTLPRGGVWERQAIYGGKRLRDEFAAEEPFVLWNMEALGEVPVDEGEGKKMVAKTGLTVSRLTEPGERFEVGTLSSAIAEMVAAVSDGDFPVEAYWSEVQTRKGLNAATVLTAVRRYIDPATL